jgi:hypothetical protein
MVRIPYLSILFRTSHNTFLVWCLTLYLVLRPLPHFHSTHPRQFLTRRLEILPHHPLLHLQNLSGHAPSRWPFLPLKIIVVYWLATTARILILANVLEHLFDFA